MKYAATNDERIARLQPQVRLAAERLLTKADRAGLDILVAQGLRTYPEQRTLYAQGRTRPGKIVTNADAGASYHNFGLALDFVTVIDGEAVWKLGRAWRRFVSLAEREGFEWGGSWTSFPDFPHLQLTGGLGLVACRSRWPRGFSHTDRTTPAAPVRPRPVRPVRPRPPAPPRRPVQFVADDALPLAVGAKDGRKKLVTRAQRALGIDDDGFFGHDTEKAVRRWQRAHHIRATGVVDPITWDTLTFPGPRRPGQSPARPAAKKAAH